MNTVTASAHRGATASDSDADRLPRKWRLLRAAKEKLPEVPRLYMCNHEPKRRAVGVSLNVKGSASWFGGVYHCANVWTCPVCAPKIAERRRGELQQALDVAAKRGNGVLLVTFTFPHGAGDVLPVILDKFTEAQRKLKSGRAAATMTRDIGYFGEIRTLEVTHGAANGWHPHVHSLWFTREQLSAEVVADLKAEIYQRWRTACLSVGLPEPSFEHGVDIRTARADIAEYVGKWGFAGELAYTDRKTAKQGGRTPWQLLADAASDTPRQAGERGSATWLWREFALAFFGKRQLFWSKRKTGRQVKKPVYRVSELSGKRVKIGEKIADEWISLREELKLAPELTDQELLDLDEKEPRITVGFIDFDTWHVIRKAHAQADVLHLVANDRAGLWGYLNFLRATVPMEDGKPPGVREDWQL